MIGSDLLVVMWACVPVFDFPPLMLPHSLLCCVLSGPCRLVSPSMTSFSRSFTHNNLRSCINNVSCLHVCVFLRGNRNVAKQKSDIIFICGQK